jgi:PAS domain S-box-containing protein
MRLATKETETENLFETLANKSPVGLYIVHDGKFCYTNPTFQSTTGYREDELLGRDALELVVPEDRERVRENAIKMLKGKLTLPYQFRVTHKNDSIKWIMESVVSVQYRGRRATLGDFIDITERKQAEEALQAEKNKLQSLIDAMEYTLTIQDTEYNIIYQNEPSRIASGGDHLGEKCYRAYEGRETVCDGCPVEEAFKDGKSHTTERRTTISGEVAFWENTANPIRDAGGRIVSCLELARDITKHKQWEQALADELTRRRILIDQSLDGIVVLDVDAKVVEANQRFAEMLGYTLEEVRELHTWDWDKKFPPEKILEMGRNVDEKGLHLETQHHRKDGSVIDVDISINAAMFGGQKLIFCVGRDVTERKRAEDALQAEKNKLQSLIDALEYILTIQDTEYNIIYQNELSRIDAGDRLGEKCYRAYEGSEKVCDGCPVEEAFKDGKSHTAERRTVMPSGEVVFWENTANPIRDAKGRIVSCLELSKNVTERKRAEETLQAEKNKLQSLIDAMEDGLTIQDRDYNIIYQNEPLKEIFGDHVGEKCYRAYASKDKVCADCPVAMAFRDGKSHTVEKEVTLPSGKVAFWEPTANPIRDAKGKIVSCLEIIRDITERKRAEEALQAERNKLQSLIDALADGLNIQDTEYNIIFQNEPSRISTGGDRVGEKCYRVFEGRDKVCDGCPVEKAFKDGKPHIAERMRILPSGEVTFWENTANPIRDAEGKVVACLEIGRNITERKKAEQALADELTRRRILVDQSLDGIVVLDVDAKVVEANQRFAEMLGYTLEEVRELHTWDWDKKFPPEKILEMGRNVDEKGLHLETQHHRKDGSVIDVDISINAAMFGGQKLIFCVGRDITERKKQEQALKDSEESYRELADSITEVFFAMDEHLRYTYWNKASEILTGIRAEDAIGKSLLEIFPDTTGMRNAEKVYRDVLRTQQSQTFVNEFDIDGRHYTFEISAYPSRGGISVFVRDITEHKQAEEALQQSEEKYRALFDSTVIGTIVIDAETVKVVMANKAAAKIFGLSSVEEGIGANPLDFAPPEGKERVLEVIVKEMFEQDLRQTREFRMITKDGREIWVSATAARIMHEGRLAGLVSLTDITVRKEMEEAIKHAAEEWRNTFDSISDAISIHDREFRILRANKAFADIFHMKPGQIIGKHCYELHKGEKPKSGCPQKQTLATEKPAVTEFYESHLGKFLLESTSPIFNEKGEVVGIVHVTRDITAQKQQNERLMMTDRLASIGELAAGTAHELNNPLTSVIGFSQLLMEKNIPDDIREDLKLIYNEAQRAASVTKNLLTFARKHTPVKQLSQINNIIEDVLKLRAYEHKVNGIEVKRRLAPDLPEIMVDNFQMQQVFLNIIINAEYFMTEAHKRGTLTITTKKQNGSTVRISIADDGPGIPQENLRRIFDPFFTTKEAGKGTGLGLSICHGIVAEHGGQIYARSQPGKGTTLFVELPINGL